MKMTYLNKLETQRTKMKKKKKKKKKSKVRGLK